CALPISIAIRRSRREGLVHKAADKYFAPIRSIVMNAFEIGRKAINEKMLDRAIESKDQRSVEVAMAGAPIAIHTALKMSLRPILQATLGAGGQAGLQILKKQLKLKTAAVGDDEDD